MPRIAIVGAGPAGSTAALALALSGRHDVVLLDREAWPRMKTCGSALSPRCLTLIEKLGVAERLQPRAYGIRGLRFTGPAGRTAVLAGNEGAWVIARAEFDAELAFFAERHGAKFIQEFKASKLLRDSAGRVRGVTDGKRDIECDLVLVADGAHSRFSPDPRPKRRIATIMSWYEGIPFTEGHLEMWFDKRVTPWYGWLFPETAKRVNIGICYDPADSANPREIFNEIVARHVGAPDAQRRAGDQISWRPNRLHRARGAGTRARRPVDWRGRAPHELAHRRGHRLRDAERAAGRRPHRALPSGGAWHAIRAGA
jgi:menaquinone-9 beta-reductase